MINFKTLKLSILIELLSDFTSHYAEMLTKSSDNEDIRSCKHTMQLLQGEIDYRNEKSNDR